MELDRLGEIELDPLAPIAEREIGEIEDFPVHHELSHKRRADEQAAEALCALAVKAALAKGRRGEPRFEVVRHTADQRSGRSEEHTSELQSLLSISYAVFFL